MTFYQNSAGLEQNFTETYRKRYGKALREFRQMPDGTYRINGILCQANEVSMMLDILENEVVEKKRSIVERLINFFKR